jgi:hypothetical protein
LEKVACGLRPGVFSDSGPVSGLAGARKKRDFCGLLSDNVNPIGC